MTSDDLSAIAAVTLGALVAVTATVTFIDSDPPPVTPEQDVWFESGEIPVPIMPVSPSPVVDFALLRPSDFSRDAMFGSEGPHRGWRLRHGVAPHGRWRQMERLERPR